ncbi:Putative integrase/recombinase y4rC [Rhodococcus opacus]|uniref:Putative integrase/recombinase y4rC n=1 Tax=Rhodococcus opacus TaxID=37919 RepID=A0A1B1K870_RHOOP|nr:tyrosine-type recombinase/integrase [Rhodococcus opacus]ANS28822.1 Putative integrase/recombinase y4rC [Rhodococcus opacus]
MTAIASTVQSFFLERLTMQRRASEHTIAAYRDTMRLLLAFMEQRTHRAPSRLDWTDLDADAICAFLDHLENDRANSARTRNARLTAIRSLFSYAALRHPEHAALIAQVLAIPPKRFDKAIVCFLDEPEAAAMLAAADRSTWAGRRDHALMTLAMQTGLRVSELLGLNCGDVVTGTSGHVRCVGKGRKERSVPMTESVRAVMNVWLIERAGQRDDAAFCTRTGRRLSVDAVQRRVTIYAAQARQGCPSLVGKHLSPHVFRHTCAMALLHAGVDTTVIALWLGHADVRSTTAYLHADLAIKERALAHLASSTSPPGRYRPPDQLLAFLEAL